MDKELDDLLDSALDDFDKKIDIKSADKAEPSLPTSSTVTIEKANLYVDDIDYEDRPPPKSIGKSTLFSSNQQTSSTTKPAEQAGFNMNDDDMKLFEEIFNDEKTKESMKQLKDSLNMFKDGDESKLLENFEKVMSQLENFDDNDDDVDEDGFDNIKDFNFFKTIAEAAQKGKLPDTKPSTSKDSDNKAEGESATSPKEQKSTLNKVLDDITKNSEKVLKNESPFPFSSDFLSNLAAGTGEDDDLDGASSVMFEPILKMLFSKDILYPSLKLMLENYDKYIEERKDKLSEEELKKCYDQRECIKEMVKVYEEAKETDSKETKSEQLKKILDLLEKCGMPPPELVPEVNPFEALGDQIKGTSCPIS